MLLQLLIFLYHHHCRNCLYYAEKEIKLIYFLLYSTASEIKLNNIKCQEHVKQAEALK